MKQSNAKFLLKMVFVFFFLSFPLKFIFTLIYMAAETHLYPEFIGWFSFFENTARLASVTFLIAVVLVFSRKKINIYQKVAALVVAVTLLYPVIIIMNPSTIHTLLFFLPFGVPMQGILGSRASTALPPGMSWKQLRNLQPGMDKAEVRRSLGVESFKRPEPHEYQNEVLTPVVGATPPPETHQYQDEVEWYSRSSSGKDYWSLALIFSPHDKKLKQVHLSYQFD